MEIKKVKKISQKELMFIEEYILTGNIRESYIKAGYKEKGAIPNGSRLYHREHIQEEIIKRQQDIQKLTNTSRERLESILYNLIEEAYIEDTVDKNSILKSVDILNKMNNFYNQDVSPTEIKINEIQIKITNNNNEND